MTQQKRTAGEGGGMTAAFFQVRGGGGARPA